MRPWQPVTPSASARRPGPQPLLPALQSPLAPLQHCRTHGDVPMDCYGTGEDLEAVRQEAEQRRLGLRFHGAKDHLDKSMHEYQVGR